MPSAPVERKAIFAWVVRVSELRGRDGIELGSPNSLGIAPSSQRFTVLSMPEWLRITLSVLGVLAVPSTIVTAIGWLVQLSATRSAQARQAVLSAELENLKSQLHLLEVEHQDTLARKREVYARFLSGMRVIIGSEIPSTNEDKKAFLKAYDESCLWAPPTIASAICDFMKTIEDRSKSSQEEKKASYQRCVMAMRNECLGKLEPEFEYRFVSFGGLLK